MDVKAQRTFSSRHVTFNEESCAPNKICLLGSDDHEAQWDDLIRSLQPGVVINIEEGNTYPILAPWNPDATEPPWPQNEPTIVGPVGDPGAASRSSSSSAEVKAEQPQSPLS